MSSRVVTEDIELRPLGGWDFFALVRISRVGKSDEEEASSPLTVEATEVLSGVFSMERSSWEAFRIDRRVPVAVVQFVRNERLIVKGNKV